MAPRTLRKAFLFVLAGCTPVLADWEGLPMPESPAAAAIGTADTTILKPATAKDLAASLIRVASRGGKVTSGINLEFAPMTLLRGTRMSESAYSALSTGPRQFGFVSASLPFSPSWILANTTVSLATGAKEGSSTSTDKLALGIKVPLYDYSDQRIGAYGCYRALKAKFARAKEVAADLESKRAARIEYAATAQEVELASESADLNIRATTMLRQCMQASKPPWNAPSAALAFAQAWTDIGTADKARLTRDARYGWLAVASPLGTSQSGEPQPGEMQLVIQGRLARDVLDTTKTVAAGEAPIKYRGNAGAFRFRAGEEKLNIDLNGSIERRRYSDGKSENVKVGSLGLELRVMEGLWIKLSMGYERKDLTGGNPFVNTSFKWGTNKESEGTYMGLQRALQ